ncbi:c-type cytochrome biogenesis protein CcsB [Okibacterium endophyticum]
MAIYALAFIAFALDLGRRSAEVRSAAEAADASAAESAESAESADVAGVSAVTAATASAGTASGDAASTGAIPAASTGTATLTRPARRGARDDGAEVEPKRSPSLRVAVALTVIAFLLHLGATVLRGVAAERVPWSNMYEFAMTGTLLIVAVYLGVLLRVDLRFIGTFVIGLVVVLLGLSTVNFYVAVVPLPPALQSAWLVIHVFVASLGTAFLALGFALSVLQLVQHRREVMGLDLKRLKLKFMATLPSSERLENLAYRVNIVGFIFWTFTLIAGAIWAERAWGRYWGWDTKEVWTFIIWVVFAGYIHARATRGWRGSRSAWLSIIGFSAVLFNFGVVNVFFKGLHTYSGL